MWGFESIRWVSCRIGEIGQTMQNDASAKFKQYAPDSEKVRPALWSLAGELAKEFVVTKIPGGRWLWKTLKQSVQKIQSGGSSSGEQEGRSENASLEEIEGMRKRISRLERDFIIISRL